MPFIRSLLATLGLTSALFIGSSLVGGQNSKSEHEASDPTSAPRLRRVVLRHPGCITCDDTTMNREQEYIAKHVQERPTVETVYDQKKVDDMKHALEDFWRERSTAVEVSATLTQVGDGCLLIRANAPRFAILEFDVYRTY